MMQSVQKLGIPVNRWVRRIAIAAAVLVAAIGWQSGVALAECTGQGNATLVMKGRTELGSTVKFKIGGAGHERFKLLSTMGAGPSEIPGVGTFCLDFSAGKTVVASGTFGPHGVRSAYWTLPDDPSLVGETFAFQAASTDPEAPNGVAISNAWVFELSDVGASDICTEKDGAEVCGVASIGFIAPVYIVEPLEEPADVRVCVSTGDDPQSILDEVTFAWSPDAPPTLPLVSASGRLTVTKITHHSDAVVVMASLDMSDTASGRLPDLVRIETSVGENLLVRELDTVCGEPLFVGKKLSPFYVSDLEPYLCETIDCPLTLDFETEDDFTTPLDNGQDISTEPEFGVLVAIDSSGNNQGAAVFDTTIDGPNAAGPDPDLLVGLGNAMILQSNDSPTQSTPGYFDTPNDSARGGSLYFDFVYRSELTSIDLIDIDTGPQSAAVYLTDSEGRQRTYFVPAGWTGDVEGDGPPGYATLDLATLEDQPGFASTATASEDPGFDPESVVTLEVFFEGSGATDNLVFCPDIP